MKVLVACEESQAVTIELRKLGHEAYSCDIEPCSGGHPEWHIRGDVVKLLYPDILICSLEDRDLEEMYGEFQTMDGKYHELPPKWDMIIAFPPCTYLSNAGAARLYPKKGQLDQERFNKGMKAKEFFMMFYNTDCPRIAIENPIPTRIYGLPRYTQVIQPYEHGHPYSKKTCLWLKNLPLLEPTKIVEPEISWVSGGSKDHLGNPRSNKGITFRDSKTKSKTFPGIAKAMAEQWGSAERDNELPIYIYAEQQCLFG